MLFRKQKTNKQTKYNFELNKNFDKQQLHISKADLNKSLESVFLLTEYIRYCYFENYKFKNKHLLNKYCKLLLNFENSNHPILIKSCRDNCKKILNSVKNHPISIKTIDLCFEMSNSNYDDIKEFSDEIMNKALGTHIRGVSY